MAHAHDHDDGHGEPTGGSTRRLAVVAVINFVGFAVELAGGLLFGSVALVGDAVHMLFDMLAYVMAFAASYTAERFEGGDEWSYGLHRLEPVAAFLNAVLLLPMVGYILLEAVRRFRSPVDISPGMTLLVATGGLVVNVVSVYALRGDDRSLNERGAFYHLLGDAGGSVAVIVSTVAVAAFDLRIADPIAAVGIAALVLWSAGTVFRESTSILLQRSPVSTDALREELAAVDGVERVVDVHVWRVCSRLTVASVRLVGSGSSLDEYSAVRSRVHDHLDDRGVHHATVEVLESADDSVRTTHSH